MSVCGVSKVVVVAVVVCVMVVVWGTVAAVLAAVVFVLLVLGSLAVCMVDAVCVRVVLCCHAESN